MFTDRRNSSDLLTLPEIFSLGLANFNNLEEIDGPTNCSDVQYEVKKCIKLLEKATNLCSLADIFSKNEGIEEVATENLQYFLLPALLGSLHLKLTSGVRRNIVEVSEVYFTDFMQRCVEYGLCEPMKKESRMKDLQSESSTMSEMEELTILAKRRAVKISRFNEQKELKKRLIELKGNMENEHVDEDIKRSYFLTMIELYIHQAIDELNSLDLEKILLDHMAKLKKNDMVRPSRRPNPALRPVVITSNILQEDVFSVKYPHSSTMNMGQYQERILKSDGEVLRNSSLNFHHDASIDASHQFLGNLPLLESDIETDDYHILEAIRQKAVVKDGTNRIMEK